MNQMRSKRQQLLISLQEKVVGKAYRENPTAGLMRGEWKRVTTENLALATVNTHPIPPPH